MCEFCENEYNYETLGSMSISVGLFGNLIVDADLDVNNNSIVLCASREIDGVCNNSVNVKINYCPICGRDLRSAGNAKD
jgi:hypothetical protein